MGAGKHNGDAFRIGVHKVVGDGKEDFGYCWVKQGQRRLECEDLPQMSKEQPGHFVRTGQQDGDRAIIFVATMKAVSDS